MDMGDDRTAVWVGKQHGNERVGPPRILDYVGPEPEGDDAGQRPQVLPDCDVGSLVQPLGDARDDE